MSKLYKILLVVFCVIFVELALFLAYITFINPAFNVIEKEYIYAAMAGFAIAIFKVTKQARNKTTISQYELLYQNYIKDSFSEEPKKLDKLLKGIKYFNENKFDAAIKIFDSLIPECTTKTEKYCVNLFLALTYSDKGNAQKEIEIYKSMIVKGYADSTIHSNLIHCYRACGEYENAYEAAKAALYVDPKNYNALDNVAWTYFEDGKFEEAIEHAKKAIEIKNDFVQPMTLLYIIYSIEGNADEAKIYERKAIANGRSKKELEERLEYYID
ncbi:tetratricopeptide repeat protein [Treponema sp.]|uniref:tetratricopeptide repeat protein n=1 Tax=Treponema sp. TaxID=166 RepID=UPI00298E9D67|nr:tetratricopeptide repeat protein [Treponema sp.]MCR5614224.1 tetratricopeptide repeat protein [Treponema sp.]